MQKTKNFNQIPSKIFRFLHVLRFLLFSHNLDFYFLNKISFSGTLCVVPWGAGNALGHPWHPQILADQLTLSQPGDRLCPPNYYWHPWIFSPSDRPASMWLPTLFITQSIHMWFMFHFDISVSFCVPLLEKVQIYSYF